MTRLMFAVLVAALCVTLLPTKAAMADEACWRKRECSQNNQCQVYVDDSQIPVICKASIPEGWHQAALGQTCLWWGASGADGCVPVAEVDYIPHQDGPICFVRSRANLIQNGCCSVPCPPGTPWCQEF